MSEVSTDQLHSVAVLICDDEARTRQALTALLLTREIALKDTLSPSIQLVGEACQVIEASKMVDIYQPQVVIMDAPKPGGGGLQVVRKIKSKWPQIKVVMLSMYPDVRSTALEAGVDKFLLKGCSPETLFEAILN